MGQLPRPFLLEARALQYNLRKTAKIGKIDEVKQLNNFMETRKISNAIKCLTGELVSGKLSPNDKNSVKTVYGLLKVKHPIPSQVNPNYRVDENTFESILYHPAIFENIGR